MSQDVDLSQKDSLEMLNVSTIPTTLTFLSQAIEAQALQYIEELKGYAMTDNSYLYSLEGDCRKQYGVEKQKLM